MGRFNYDQCSHFFSLFEWKEPFNRQKLQSSLVAIAIGLCITGYIIMDKVVLEYISPLALTEIHNLVYVLALLPGTFRSNQLKQEWRINWKTILVGAILVPGSYLLFLFAMSLAQVAQLSPIREIGIVFGTLFGIFILKEQQGLRRIAISTVILLGIFVLSLWG